MLAFGVYTTCTAVKSQTKKIALHTQSLLLDTFTLDSFSVQPAGNRSTQTEALLSMPQDYANNAVHRILCQPRGMRLRVAGRKCHVHVDKIPIPNMDPCGLSVRSTIHEWVWSWSRFNFRALTECSPSHYTRCHQEFEGKMFNSYTSGEVITTVSETGAVKGNSRLDKDSHHQCLGLRGLLHRGCRAVTWHRS